MLYEPLMESAPHKKAGNRLFKQAEVKQDG